MIAPPRPNTPGFRILAAVVDNHGELDAQAIADSLYPPPKLAGPITSRAGWAAWATAKAEHRREKAARVSRMLGRLTEAGLIGSRGAPIVSRWFADLAMRRGLTEAMERAHPAWPAPVPPLVAHREMVEEVGKGPTSARSLLGSQPSGARKKVYRQLVEWGVIVSGSQRVATSAGVAVVEGGR